MLLEGNSISLLCVQFSQYQHVSHYTKWKGQENLRTFKSYESN